MGKAEEVLGRRQSEGQPARETALDCNLPSTRSVDFVQTSVSLAQGLHQKSLPRLVEMISMIIYW